MTPANSMYKSARRICSRPPVRILRAGVVMRNCGTSSRQCGQRVRCESMGFPQNTHTRAATVWLCSETDISSKNPTISLGFSDLGVKRVNPDSKQPRSSGYISVLFCYEGRVRGTLDPQSPEDSVSTSHEYSVRLEKFAAAIAAKQRRHILIGNTNVGVVVSGLLLVGMSVDKEWLSPYWLALPFCLYVALAILHEQVLRARARAETAAAFYRKGLARIEDRWVGTGQTGDRFHGEAHVYAEDLDLFGRGGLFELLSIARLPMGENQLAHWLRFPSSRRAILERQGLLQELRDKLDLREDLAGTGEDLRTRLNPESLVDWAEGSRVLPKSLWRFVAAVLALGTAAAIFYYFAGESYRIALILLAID